MSTILDKANQIKLEKDTKIIPGNIKAGVQIFDVVGTHQGGIEDITNGRLIHCKAANNTVPANTFVSLVKNNLIIEDTDLEGNYLSVILIDTNKLFITYRANSSLFVRLGTINNDIVTLGTPVQVINANNNGYDAKAVLIDTNTVFIYYRDSSSGTAHIAAVVCTINGDVITVGSLTALSTETSYKSPQDIYVLDTNKVFITYDGTNGKLSGMICTVSGTTITPGTGVILSNTNSSGYGGKICSIDTDKFLIAHNVSSSGLFGLVCTISGTTITTGNDILLDSSSDVSEYINIFKVTNNKALITYKRDDKLYAIVCSVAGATISSYGTPTLLSSGYEAYKTMGGLSIDDNKLILSYTNDNYQYSIVLYTVSGNTFTTSDEKSSGINPIIANYLLIDTNKILGIHSVTTYTESGQNTGWNSEIINITESDLEIVTSVKPSEINPYGTAYIEGIATTECTTTTAGDVYIIDVGGNS